MGTVIAKFTHPDKGQELQRREINRLCKINGEYELATVYMKEDITTVRLIGYFEWFNSIFFDFFEDGKEVDIYTDPRFNPFIRGHGHVN